MFSTHLPWCKFSSWRRSRSIRQHFAYGVVGNVFFSESFAEIPPKNCGHFANLLRQERVRKSHGSLADILRKNDLQWPLTEGPHKWIAESGGLTSPELNRSSQRGQRRQEKAKKRNQISRTLGVVIFFGEVQGSTLVNLESSLQSRAVCARACCLLDKSNNCSPAKAIRNSVVRRLLNTAVRKAATVAPVNPNVSERSCRIVFIKPIFSGDSRSRFPRLPSRMFVLKSWLPQKATPSSGLPQGLSPQEISYFKITLVSETHLLKRKLPQ